MSLHRTLLALGAAAFALALGTAAASAATAYASTTVNVRAGAGTGYGVVDVLHEGERVDVDRCKGAWCFVEKSGPDGWVNANYLTQDRFDRDDERYDRYDRYDRRDDFEFFDGEDMYDDDGFIIVRPHRHIYRPFYRSQVCVGGNNASFCLSN